ncbi:efflux RND transporter periplasmic adaptor subunit [Sphingomonas hylomeconis]|uniref:Efflux RND transporter periplasmic adaptor subunit n=2 Tax=Sphingomonas hylomeconis TaxID=1395958 RepID=A0ABV7SZK4_9SPHN
MRYPPLSMLLHGALIACALALTGCSGTDAEAAKDVPASLTVTVTRPQQLSWPQQLSANGTLQPWQEVVISAETGPYRIASLNADVGSRVRQGQVLATLAREALLAERARLQAAVAEAQANLVKANSDVERARQIGDSGALSAQQIQSYRVTQQTSQATLAAARAQVRGADVQLGQANVRAADDGVVSSRTALLGKVVNAGDEMFRLVRQGIIEWQAELDSRQIAAVRAGQVARVTLPGGQSVSGTVRLVSPTLTSTTSRGIVYVRLPANSPARSGMYGSGVIEVGAGPVLTVPDSAIVLRDGKSYAYLLGKDNRVKETVVTAGQRRDGRVAVSGIAADAQVVAAGSAFLSDGVTVRVTRSAAK